MITPASGYLVVEPIKEKTPEGIILPSSYNTKPQQGKVISIGDDLTTDYGIKKSSPCKIDDIVVYREWGGKEYVIDDKEYLILKFDDIMGVINEN
jgi:chaperonin GroES